MLGEFNEAKGEVVGKLIDKVSNAIGVLYDPTGIKEGNRIFSKAFLENLANDEVLSYEEKMQILAEYKLIGKKNKNRKKIIEKAGNHINEGANPNGMSESWIMNFWEMSGNISEDELQDLWASILAAEVNCPNTISKRLLFNLSLMSQKNAKDFQNLSRFCFYDRYSDIAHPIIFIKKNSTEYLNCRISAEMLRELEGFNLIETNYDRGFVFKNKKPLMYTNHYIELRASKIYAGDVRLTEDGQALFKLIKKENDNQILEYTIQLLEYHGVEVKVTYR